MAASTSHRAVPQRVAPPGPRLIVAVIAVVYLVVGVLGLAQVGADTSTGSPSVAGFGGTPVLNIAHVAVGVLAAVSAVTGRLLRVFGIAGMVLFLGFTTYGIVDLIRGEESELGIDLPATVLHALTLAACVVVVLIKPPATVDEFRTRTNTGDDV